MPWGHRDPETDEIVPGPGIPNLSFEYLSPRPKPRAWRCRIHQKKMFLDPLDLSLPAESWYCRDCDRKVSLDERDNVCLKEVEQLKQKYNLKDMQYNLQRHKWYLISNEWSSPDGTRQTSHRKQLNKTQEENITDELLDTLQIQLRIEVSTFEEFFVDE